MQAVKSLYLTYEELKLIGDHLSPIIQRCLYLTYEELKHGNQNMGCHLELTFISYL
ncbi:hypothetical protein B4064_3842 [Caldibacillus thermoamylovorans]|nr:hypothetical protein B4064_3842 [Caldibacillus thermoamylovorans]KIO56661.1 hypothetical protein B4065_3821 [Caldibacillus thermoamylovorans]